MALIKIEVAYALPDRQKIIACEVEAGTTILDAISQSGILDFFPEIDLAKQDVGVFGERCKLSDVVQPDDRIEIYRPLIIDPKEARRARVQKKLGGSRKQSHPK